MEKVGILTFWGVPNYGAFAQAYALNRLLKNIYGEKADVVHLAYLHERHRRLYFKKRKPSAHSFKSCLSLHYYINRIKFFLNNKIAYPSFDKDWDSINHVDIKSEFELEHCFCDVIVTGSDAIWEYSVPDFGDDIHLIGNSLDCNKLVSYAASFGDMSLNDEFKEFCKTGLKKYDSISVRDNTSKQIVAKLIGRDCAQIVLDPTLMWDFKHDNRIPEPAYSNYILVYGNEFGEKLIKEVKDYARNNNLTVIGAGIAPEWCDIRLTDIGPLEWIGMFKKAEFTVTCTFHGLMFSINFEKKVVFNQVEYVKNRSTTLLRELDLYGLYENGTELNKVLEYQWNYEHINSKLEAARSDSMAFIRSFVENE